jgi:hypothetical protein
MRAWVWERRIIRRTFGTVDVVTRDEEERGEDIEGVKRRRSMNIMEPTLALATGHKNNVSNSPRGPTPAFLPFAFVTSHLSVFVSMSKNGFAKRT